MSLIFFIIARIKRRPEISSGWSKPARSRAEAAAAAQRVREWKRAQRKGKHHDNS
jgi:hypothetical protein